MSKSEPQLVACINVFNERWALPSCLHYSYPYFDRYVIADGAYVGRSENPKSTDGSMDVVRRYIKKGPMAMLTPEGRAAYKKQYGLRKMSQLYHKFKAKPVTLIQREGFWENEVNKRNAMLAEVGEGDWHFYMDADWKPIWKKSEATVEAIKSLPESVDSLFVSIAKPWGLYDDEEGKKRVPVARNPDFMAFRRRHGVHFAYNHYTLADATGTMVWERSDWERAELGILFEELRRPDQNARNERKKLMFQRSEFIELANGWGRYVCDDCHHGEKILKEDGDIAGFLIQRGFRTVCPKCGSGNLGNPAFVGKWGMR